MALLHCAHRPKGDRHTSVSLSLVVELTSRQFSSATTHTQQKTTLDGWFFCYLGRMIRLALLHCAHRPKGDRHTSVSLSLVVELTSRQFSSATTHTQQKTTLDGWFFCYLGRMIRFELTTSGTTNQRSNQLSYIRHGR